LQSKITVGTMWLWVAGCLAVLIRPVGGQIDDDDQCSRSQNRPEHCDGVAVLNSSTLVVVIITALVTVGTVGYVVYIWHQMQTRKKHVQWLTDRMRAKPPPPCDIYLGPTAFHKEFTPLESQPWRCGEDADDGDENVPGSKYTAGGGMIVSGSDGYSVPGESGWGGGRGQQETAGGLMHGPNTSLRLREDTGFDVPAFRKWFLEKQIAKARGETEVSAALGQPKSFFEDKVHDALFWKLRLTPKQAEALAKKFLVFKKLKMRSLRTSITSQEQLVNVVDEETAKEIGKAAFTAVVKAIARMNDPDAEAYAGLVFGVFDHLHSGTINTDEYMAFMVLSNSRYDLPTRLGTYFSLNSGDGGILGAAEMVELCFGMFDLAEFSGTELWPETVEEAAAPLISLLGCAADAAGNYNAIEVDEYEFKEASLANLKLRTLFKVMDAAAERANGPSVVASAPPQIVGSQGAPARRQSKIVMRTEEEELAELQRRALGQKAADAEAAAAELADDE